MYEDFDFDAHKNKMKEALKAPAFWFGIGIVVLGIIIAVCSKFIANNRWSTIVSMGGALVCLVGANASSNVVNAYLYGKEDPYDPTKR